MTFLLPIVLLITVGLLALAAWLVLDGFRSKGHLARALNMSLFLVTVPRDADDPTANRRPDKELIAIMEQLYTTFTNIHASGWNKFAYGEPYIALEMAVPHVGEEIHFYIAVPKSFEPIFEKQVHGLYPTAHVERVKDYNIFNPDGVGAGAYLKLKSQPILPFRTYTHLESDPLGSLVSALSKIDHTGEGAAIQILIRPSHRQDIRSLAEKVAHHMQTGFDFKKALSLAQSKDTAKTEADKPTTPRTVTPFEEQTVKALQAKASRPLFDANVRLLVSAGDQTRAKMLLDDLAGAFVQFAAPDMNSFAVNAVTDRALEDLAFKYAFRLFDDGQVAQLSSEEIASLYHFPLPGALAPKVKFLKSRTAEPPANLPSEGIILGVNAFRGQERQIRMTDTDRRRHLYIVGQTGTGKSSFMKRMLAQDLAAGKGICLVDPHGEFAQYALSIVPPERADDVIYFDPGDIDRPMGLNMFEIDPSHPEQKTSVIDELFGIFNQLYDLKTTGGPMFERYFKNSALLLLDDYAHEVPVLADIARVLTDEAYRADKLSRETNPLVKEFWQKEAQKAGGEASLANMAPYISSKVTAFVYNEFLRPIINQPKSAFNLREVIDNRKILIVNLSKGRIGDINAGLLGRVIVGKLLMAALSRVDIADENQRQDFFLYIDEFHNFTTPSISTILSEARKYRLDLIIAHQYIKQLDEGIRNAVFGNVGSMVAFRVGADDAEFLKNQFEPVFSPTDLLNIDNFNAHVRLLVNNQTTRPFNMQTIREDEGSPSRATNLKEQSRLRFGRPRAEVEAEIQSKFTS